MSSSSSSAALEGGLFAKQNGSKKTVGYFYDTDIGSYYYGPGHPMKPQRIRMTHSLIQAYDLYEKMDVYRPHDASEVELTKFHDSDYIRFLSEIDPDNYRNFTSRLRRYNVGDATDCPVFDGLFEFQQSCAGASIDAAAQLNLEECDIAINWSGGLHHAKRSEASGFCYINDIVLGILELLKYHTRVMYIDIDIHHGDGVEEAFFLTHRVMTVSFHKFGDFFPGTGDVTDVGAGNGKYYAVNVPLDDGITDDDFIKLYREIVPKAVEVYQPGAIVLQCGADSVTGDRLGLFNLSIKGHAKCVEITKSLNIPLLILGGGGYTIRNVARTWLYETATILDTPVSNNIPVNDYLEYFSPEFQLHLTPSQSLTNKNSPQYLEALRCRILQHLSHVEHAPSVQFQPVPSNFFQRDLPCMDEDDMAQQLVEWEGGGLAPGVDMARLSLRPLQLNKKSEGEDKSQLRKSVQDLSQIDRGVAALDMKQSSVL